MHRHLSFIFKRLIPYCKECLKAHCYDVNNDFIVERFKIVLRLINKPFLEDVWKSTVTTVDKNLGKDYFGLYMKNIQMPQFRSLRWSEVFQKDDEEINKNTVPKKSAVIEEIIISAETMDKWGNRYESEDYLAFEKKYKFLVNNYKEKTAMHTEALLNYIRYRVKEEQSTAKGDIREAKEWGNLAKDASNKAKINPEQLTPADFTDGLNTVGQLVRAVEQHEDIIPILPHFKQRPQDSVDYTIWAYINYIRDMKDLPPAEYEEIYAFYEKFKQEHKGHNFD